MRILYCNKYNFRFSGTEAYLFETMELMRSRGHEVALFSMADERGANTGFDQHVIPRTDFKSPGGLLAKTRLGLRAIYSFEARKRIARTIQEFRPDVAHVRNIYHHLSPSILWELKERNVPVLYHLNDFKIICPSYNLVSHGHPCDRCKGGKFFNVVSEGCYSGGRAASAVLAAEAYFHKSFSTYEKCVELILTPSQFAKQKLIDNGWPEARIAVLPHYQSFPPETSPHPGPSAPILYFGRLSTEKGVDDLISAMRPLFGIRLVIAGDGPERPRLGALAKERGLHNVSFAGHVAGPELEKLISESQFTVFPSHAYETMGKSILESYAQARTVIASDLGSRRELVQEGISGLLYPVGNIDSLSSAIRFLYEHPQVASRMGNAGRELLRAKHSKEQHLSVLEGIYGALSQKSKTVEEHSWFSSPRVHTPRNGKTLRIAFIGGRGVIGKYSGIETYYEELGSRLARRGQQVTAYCRSYFTPDLPEHRRIRIIRLPTLRTKHLETLIHTFLSTIHACFSDHDVVHYHTLGPSMFAFIPRLFGKKTVVTVQGLDWQRKKWGRFARAALKFCEWSSVRLPNKTVVVSRTLQDYYFSRYSKRCSYIPNGTEVRVPREGIHLKQLGLNPRQYALFLGRLSPEKNCHLLIDAFEKLDTEMKLVLAGGSSHTDEYVATLRKHQSDRIKFLNWLSGDALEEVLTNATLFVLPSDMEGMSLALLDAMGAGICVLASDVPENREVIKDAGFTFKRADTEDLKRMLALLLSNAELRESAGRRAQQRVREHYLWHEIAAEMNALYASIASPRKRSQAETVLTNAA